MGRKGIIRRLFALLAGILSFGMGACTLPSELSDEEIMRTEAAIVDGARAIPGVTDVRLNYGRKGPTGSLNLDGRISIASANPSLARAAFEELHRIAASVLPDRSDSYLNMYVVADDDEYFRFEERDLGFANPRPSFHEVIEIFGNSGE